MIQDWVGWVANLIYKPMLWASCIPCQEFSNLVTSRIIQDSDQVPPNRKLPQSPRLR